MGAHNIQQIIVGKTLAEAYKSACEQAQIEYGDDAYNGTISTTTGAVLKTMRGKFTRRNIAAWVEAETLLTEKWGKVHALELPRAAAQRLGVDVPRDQKAFIVVGWAAE